MPPVFDLLLGRWPHRMHTVHRCGLLHTNVVRSVVCISVSVCNWAQPLAMQKWLNQSRRHLQWGFVWTPNNHVLCMVQIDGRPSSQKQKRATRINIQNIQKRTLRFAVLFMNAWRFTRPVWIRGGLYVVDEGNNLNTDGRVLACIVHRRLMLAVRESIGRCRKEWQFSLTNYSRYSKPVNLDHIEKWTKLNIIGYTSAS